jgi:hypothetical protein
MRRERADADHVHGQTPVHGPQSGTVVAGSKSFAAHSA